MWHATGRAVTPTLWCIHKESVVIILCHHSAVLPYQSKVLVQHHDFQSQTLFLFFKLYLICIYLWSYSCIIYSNILQVS